MTTRLPEETDVRWRSASDANNTCVEVAHHYGAVRDSKAPAAMLLADAAALLAWARVWNETN